MKKQEIEGKSEQLLSELSRVYHSEISYDDMFNFLSSLTSDTNLIDQTISLINGENVTPRKVKSQRSASPKGYRSYARRQSSRRK